MSQLLTARAACAASLPDEPPTEAKLFSFGSNTTLNNGDLTLTPEGARDVMATYQARGIDLQIDLEHQSLEADDKSRADAADARGWAKLELRADGLWLTNIRWTEDGVRRLKSKTQRYLSPVVLHTESGEIKSIFNVALVANPATFGAQPLVAASARPCARANATHASEVRKLNAQALAACLILRRQKHGIGDRAPQKDSGRNRGR